MKKYLYTIVNELTKEVKHASSLRKFCIDINETIGLPSFITIDQANDYWNRKGKKTHILEKLPSHIIFYRGLAIKNTEFPVHSLMNDETLKEYNKNVPLL